MNIAASSRTLSLSRVFKLIHLLVILCLFTPSIFYPVQRAGAEPGAEASPPPPAGKLLPESSQPAAKTPAASHGLPSDYRGPLPQLRSSWGPAGEPARVELQPTNPGPATPLAVQEWQTPFQEDFESEFPGARWTVYDSSGDGYERTWGANDLYVNSGALSVWSAAGGAEAVNPSEYFAPDNLDAWMVSGPYNLADGSVADLSFSAWFDTEVDYDWLFVGASTDGNAFYGSTWTGNSGGWAFYDYDLSQFAGASQVWIAFYVHSDESSPEPHEGVWIDDVTLWKWVPPASSETIQNGDFEAGSLDPWSSEGSTAGIYPRDDAFSGSNAAWLGGLDNAQDKLYQRFSIPNWTQAAEISYWVNVISLEVSPGYDTFCARLYSVLPTDPLTDTGAVDIGCVDGIFTTDGWNQVSIPLIGDQLDQIRGQDLYLYFYLQTDVSNPSSVWLDDIQFKVTEEVGDANEGNNSPDTATPLSFNSPISALSIDPANDHDWFSFSGTAGQTITIDLDSAEASSGLDTFARLLDSSLNELAFSDDDGASLDALITHTLPADGTYFIDVNSYDGSGDHAYEYSLKLTDQAAAGSLLQGHQPDRPEPRTPNAPKEWTFILYLNGAKNSEDAALLDVDRRNLEASIGSKSSFVNVVALIDGPGSSDSYRYLIQPNGNYRENVNKWKLGEQNMGNPQTLVDFTKWAMSNYPAQRYLLVIDDHGSGMRMSGDNYRQAGSEYLPLSDLTPNTFYTALKTINTQTGRKIDLLFNRSCLMSTFDNLYSLKDFVNYAVSFESQGLGLTMNFPFLPWLYKSAVPRTLESLRPGTSALDLGKQMLGHYEAYIGRYSSRPYVLSLVDLSKLDNLRIKLDIFADILREKMATLNGIVKLARFETQKMDSVKEYEVIDVKDRFVDVWHFADRLSAYVPYAATAAGDLKSAVDAAVVDKRVKSSSSSCLHKCRDYSNSHGISIYFPYSPDNDFIFYKYGWWYMSTRVGKWDDTLVRYFSYRPSGYFAQTGGMEKSLAADPWWLSSESMPVNMGFEDQERAAYYELFAPLLSKQ